MLSRQHNGGIFPPSPFPSHHLSIANPKILTRGRAYHSVKFKSHFLINFNPVDKCPLEMSSFLAYWIEKAGARSLSHFARTKERVFAGREFRRSFANTPLSPANLRVEIYLSTWARPSFFSRHPYSLPPLPPFVFSSTPAKGGNIFYYILVDIEGRNRINYIDFEVDEYS